jgi:hypothetical protein
MGNGYGFRSKASDPVARRGQSRPKICGLSYDMTVRSLPRHHRGQGDNGRTGKSSGVTTKKTVVQCRSCDKAQQGSKGPVQVFKVGPLCKSAEHTMSGKTIKPHQKSTMCCQNRPRNRTPNRTATKGNLRVHKHVEAILWISRPWTSVEVKPIIWGIQTNAPGDGVRDSILHVGFLCLRFTSTKASQ